MKIKVDSMITISEPTKEIENFIKSELEIKNPEIEKKKRMGFWTGNVPKIIKIYMINSGKYIIPIGEIDNIWKLHPYKEDYIIDFGKHEKLDYPKNSLKLYDYQEKAVSYMQKIKRGILSSKCGSRKKYNGVRINTKNWI